MIIAATRCLTRSGHAALADHVLRGPGNERITLLQGAEADLADAVELARRLGCPHALRHYVLAPALEMSDGDIIEVLADLGEEFGFDPAVALLVRHDKPRAPTRAARAAGEAPLPAAMRPDTHWHAVVPEVCSVTLRVLDSRHMRPRHEKLSRLVELQHGQPVVQGRWNRAVLDHLDRRAGPEGRRQAERLEDAGLRPGLRPRAAYSSTQRRVLERTRHDHRRDPQPPCLPDLVHALRRAWHRAHDAEALRQALRGHGMRVAAETGSGRTLGDTDIGADLRAPERLVVEGWDARAQRLYVLGTLPRLLGASPDQVAARLARLRLSPPPAGILPERPPSAPAAKARHAPPSPPASRGLVHPARVRPPDTRSGGAGPGPGVAIRR